MKKITSILILAALASCDVNDPIYYTSHPEQGKITFSMDFSQRTDGVTVPAEVTAKVGQHSATLATGQAVTFPNLVDPGTYHINIYNAADKISVSGTTASVTVTAGVADPLPGWFFTYAADQVIEKDKDYDLTALMRQQVRELTLVIEPTGGTVEKIATVDATLTGVASQLNIDDSTPSTPVSVKPAFTKQSDGNYKATVRLLGMAGDEQRLTVVMSFTGGNPQPVTESHDLSALLANFNGDKKIPLTLGAQAVETPTGAGFTATITPWTVVTGTGTAE